MTDIAMRRRRQILAAAVCFGRRGFHRATMPEICGEAGLSPGTVYRYFRSKDDLIEALVEADRAESVGLIEEIGRAPDTLAALAAAVDDALAAAADPVGSAIYAEVIAEATRNPRVAALVAGHDEGVVTALAEVVRRGQERREIDVGLEPRVLALLLVDMPDGLTLRKGIAPGTDLTAYAAVLKAVVARALAPTDGAAR